MSSGPLQSSIQVDGEVLSDLSDMLRHNEHIETVATIAIGQPPGASTRGFSKRVAAASGVSAAAAFDILYALLNIFRLKQASGLNAQETVSELTSQIERNAPPSWLSENFGRWQQAESSISNALAWLTDDHPLVVSQKAQLLAYSHGNLLVSSKLITDVRPVFNADATQILETVITHTLRIQYTDAMRHHRVQMFALDSLDVAVLRKACERAETKAKVAKESLDKLNPVILPDD
jgi:hypothetical protein